MTDPIPTALRVLGHFWLQEIRSEDIALISALPGLSDGMAGIDSDTLSDLAVEYQRLFGFNLPPYESVFIDPSSMLMAPATGRVQALYHQAGWSPPAGARIGAPDHIGVELIALADWWTDGPRQLLNQLQTRHLALWAPTMILALDQLRPHPFYMALGSLTLDLLLATLPPDPIPADDDPFPILPPPPTYRGHDMHPPPNDADDEMAVGLRDIVRQLLTPREAGLFLTRQDIVRISRALELPEVMGERRLCWKRYSDWRGNTT